MILFVGQVERGMREREAFQELDYRAVFGSMTKWATEIDDPDAGAGDRVARLPYRRQWPAVPAPWSSLSPKTCWSSASRFPTRRLMRRSRPRPARPRWRSSQTMLGAARAPDRVARRQPLERGGRSAWRALPKIFAAGVRPAFAAPRCSIRLHPCYAGDLGIGPNPKLKALASRRRSRHHDRRPARRNAIQSYTLFDIPTTADHLVHVHPGAEELGRVYSPHLAIHATPTPFTAALETLAPRRHARLGGETAHADYLAWTDTPTAAAGRGQFWRGDGWLRDNLPTDAILCNGAGNYAAWIHRFFRFRRFATMSRRPRARWAMACRRRWR
jgi:acetolactate synthase-1/2/3 large subunit